MTDLPVEAALPALIEILTQGRNAILVAPPGAGKTTAAPLALMRAFPGTKILLLEPRRLAARAAARRMAQLLGESVGQTIGFRTRTDSAVSAATVVEVITEGLLTSRLLADPGLTGIGMVIFDEVHERSLEADLAMALVRDLQAQLRPELRILAMSATADIPRLAALLEAGVVESQGRMHPVEIVHASRDLAAARDLPEAMAKAIRQALAAHQGDILAFLPGMAEIRRAEAALAGAPAMVLPLHGDLPVAAQDLALTVQDRRRVVLATSIAETSLTVPGVRVVVDGGFRRTPRLDPGSGLTRLATARIAKAAAAQRAGRAGREAPGVAIRLWTAALQRGLPAFEPPELFQAELSGLVLACAAWGERPEALPFADPPPAAALKAARALLAELGALDADGRLTTLGREMARLRAEPRLAAMMLAAATPLERALAADLAALLEERDPLARRPGAGTDIAARLEALAGRADADRGAVAAIRHAAGLYRRRLGLRPDAVAAPAPAAGGLLAASFPDRIGQRRGADGYRLSGGGSANISDPTDPLAASPLIVAADLDAKGSRLRLGARLTVETLPDLLRARLVTTRESGFDPVAGNVSVRERLRLGALVLADRISAPAPEEAQAALAKALATRLAQLDWTEAGRNLQARARWMHTLDPAFPDLSDDALAKGVDDWLAPALAGMTNIAEARKTDVLAALRGWLGYADAKRLDDTLPTSLTLPGGAASVDYTGPVPVASAKARMFYGLDETPRLAGGKIALQLALLSPAGRPIAITADLPGFWRNGWRDARRDMRGRYPKHDWPEEPWKTPALDRLGAHR